MELTALKSLSGELKRYRNGIWTGFGGGDPEPEPTNPLEDSVTGGLLTVFGSPVYNNAGFYTFNGSTDYMDFPLTTITSYPFTISARINRTSTANFNQVPISIGNNTNIYYGFNMNGNNKRIFAANTTYVNAQFSIATTGYISMVAVFNSATDKRLYVNGVLRATLSTSVPFGAVSNLRIAATARTDVGDKFIGEINQIRLWDKALDTTEIATVTSGDTDVAIDNLKHWFKFGL